MYWVVSPAFAAAVLTAVALVVLVPSGIATFVWVHDRRVARLRRSIRVFTLVSYSLSVLVLIALATFLIVNHVRIVDVQLT